MEKKHLKGYFKGLNKAADTVEFIASTDSVDRQGDSIDPNGWDLSNLGKNLPLLWAHDDRSLPIGRVVEAHVDGNALITSVEFATKVNDFAKQVYDLVVGGFLNAVSVGFMPKSFDAEGKMVSQELLELSVVNIPANQDALRNEAYQKFQKSLEKKEEPKVELKDLKISEPQRNSLRIALDSMTQAKETISQILIATTPPDKKGEAQVKEQMQSSRETRILKSVRLMDKIGEAIIHELKNGGDSK